MYQEDDMYLPTSAENEANQSFSESKKTVGVKEVKGANFKIKHVVSEMREHGEKNYHVIHRKNRGKIIKIELFGSGARGNTIRNAVSGQRYSGHVVGSKNEDFYYKVKVSTGEVNANGDSISLFYDSPEQYEKHFGTMVDQKCKENWVNKRFLQ